MRFWVLDAETMRHLAKETSQVAYLPEAATQTRRQGPSALISIFVRAHLMLRPIHLVSDIDDYRQPLVINPPATICSDAWGPAVVVGWRDRHYEATQALAQPPAQSSIKEESAGQPLLEAKREA